MIFFLKAGAHLDSDIEVLANIDESELEGLLHDPEFLNIDPNLPPEVRKKLIENLRFVLFLILFFSITFFL